MAVYHYTESGLDNVVIEGLAIVTDHAGEKTITIPAVGELHHVIAAGIVDLPSKMNGKEVRFLRSEMGKTQAELAALLKVTNLTVSRWERGETPISDSAEMLLRLLAGEVLELDLDLDVRGVAGRVVQSPRSEPIRIAVDAAGSYHLAA